MIQTGLMSTTGWTEYAIGIPQSADYDGSRVFIVDQDAGVLTRIDSIVGAGLETYQPIGSGLDTFADPSAVRVVP